MACYLEIERQGERHRLESKSAFVVLWKFLQCLFVIWWHGRRNGFIFEYEEQEISELRGLVMVFFKRRGGPRALFCRMTVDVSRYLDSASPRK